MRRRISILLVGMSLCVVAPVRAAAAGTQAPGGDQSIAVDQAKPPQGSGTQKPAPQTAKPKPKPVPKLPLGFRLFGGLEMMKMSASESFTAQTGSSTLTGFALGGDVLNIFRQVFLRVGFSRVSKDGTRGFVDDVDAAISNGIAITHGVRNFELAAGWRNYLKKHPHIALYAGAGFTYGSHSQKSPDPEPGDNDTKSGSGFVALFGMDYALQKKAKNPLFVGVEGEFRSVAGVLGTSGISESLGEDNLGGFAIRALVGIRFKK